MDTYTDATKTRREAGFLNNANVDTTLDIEPCVKSANSEVAGAISARYNVPLSSNTNYTGSTAQYYLEKLATQLAASELLLQQYEGQGGDLLDMATKKMQWVRDELLAIRNGSVLLLGTDGAELSLKQSALSAITGFPKNADLSDTENPENLEMLGIMSEKF